MADIAEIIIYDASFRLFIFPVSRCLPAFLFIYLCRFDGRMIFELHLLRFTASRLSSTHSHDGRIEMMI